MDFEADPLAGPESFRAQEKAEWGRGYLWTTVFVHRTLTSAMITNTSERKNLDRGSYMLV